MKFHPAILSTVIALAIAAPAQAQSTNAYFVNQSNDLSRVPSLAAPQPTVRQLAAEAGAENPGVTSAAKRTYDQLSSGSLDRAKLTADVSQALPATLVRSAAHQLGTLGTPSWSFVGNARSSAGDVSIYKLQYANAVAYMTFGVSNAGVVYALSLGNKPT